MIKVSNILVISIFSYTLIYPLVKTQSRTQLPSGIPYVLRRGFPGFVESEEPIDIFLSAWESEQGLDIEPTVCTLTIPGDNFLLGLASFPVNKDLLIRAMKQKSLMHDVIYGMSQEVLTRNTETGTFVGAGGVRGATYEIPAFARTLAADRRKIFVWESEKDGTLLANGVPVLYELPFDGQIENKTETDACILLVTEGFAAGRHHELFVRYMQAISTQWKEDTGSPFKRYADTFSYFS